MVFSGHSRIGTLGSCGEAVVVMMLCKLKGIVVCVFSVFLLLVTELAFVSVSVHFVFFVHLHLLRGQIGPLPFASCVWLILMEF